MPSSTSQILLADDFCGLTLQMNPFLPVAIKLRLSPFRYYLSKYLRPSDSQLPPLDLNTLEYRSRLFPTYN